MRVCVHVCERGCGSASGDLEAGDTEMMLEHTHHTQHIRLYQREIEPLNGVGLTFFSVKMGLPGFIDRSCLFKGLVTSASVDKTPASLFGLNPNRQVQRVPRCHTCHMGVCMGQ